MGIFFLKTVIFRFVFENISMHTKVQKAASGTTKKNQSIIQ